VRQLKQALEAIVLHVNKLRVLQGYGCGKKEENASADKESKPAEPASPTSVAAATSDRNVGKATGHTDGTTPAQPSSTETVKAVEEDKLKGNDPMTKVCEQITLPLMLTREWIDKLLPERDGEKAPEYMYV